MNKKTKILTSLFTVICVILVIFMVVQTYAADPKYLNITGTREGNQVYKITTTTQEKTIWKIVSFESMNATAPALYDEAIYCINPEIGFGSETSAGNDRKQYNASFNMKDLTGVENKYRTLIPNQTNYNSVLWILDNCYLPKLTPAANKEEVKAALYDAVVNALPTSQIKRGVLTDNDIEVVQQLALWYFTSNNPDYHYEPENFPAISINDTAINRSSFIN